MLRERLLFLGALVSVLSATASLLGACSTPSSPPFGGGGHGAARPDAGAGDSGYDASPDAPDTGPKDADSDAGWMPGKDSTWTAVLWDSVCGVEVADQPKLAVPPLTWGECPDKRPGCSSLKIQWGCQGCAPATASPTVVRWGGGYRVGLSMDWNEDEDRAAVYDELGFPLVVWRMPNTKCGPMTPRVGPERVWFGVQQGLEPSFYIGEPYEFLATASKTLPVNTASPHQASSDTLFAFDDTFGHTVTIYDRIAGSAQVFGPEPGFGYQVPYVRGDTVLFKHYVNADESQGFVWTRATHAIEPLIQPQGEIVPDIKTDGNTLVWLQSPPLINVPPYPPADLWTSPFTTTKAGLVPQKRRALPPVGSGTNSAIGEGFYAVDTGDQFVQYIDIVRLSDAHHWQFMIPKDAWKLCNVAYIDADEVWYQTMKGVYRQKLDALGPGDPAP